MHFFKDTVRALHPCRDKIDRVPLIADVKLRIKDIEFGADLLQRTRIHHAQLLIFHRGFHDLFRLLHRDSFDRDRLAGFSQKHVFNILIILFFYLQQLYRSPSWSYLAAARPCSGGSAEQRILTAWRNVCHT